jgi:hypothetical protein
MSSAAAAGETTQLELARAWKMRREWEAAIREKLHKAHQSLKQRVEQAQDSSSRQRKSNARRDRHVARTAARVESLQNQIADYDTRFGEFARDIVVARRTNAERSRNDAFRRARNSFKKGEVERQQAYKEQLEKVLFMLNGLRVQTVTALLRRRILLILASEQSGLDREYQSTHFELDRLRTEVPRCLVGLSL